MGKRAVKKKKKKELDESERSDIKKESRNT